MPTLRSPSTSAALSQPLISIHFPAHVQHLQEKVMRTTQWNFAGALHILTAPKM